MNDLWYLSSVITNYFGKEIWSFKIGKEAQAVKSNGIEENKYGLLQKYIRTIW